MDSFKKNIKGYVGPGHRVSGQGTCPCCREVPGKVASRRLARHRLASADRGDLTAEE